MTTAILENLVPVKNLKRITIYVPPDLYEALESWAANEDRSISNLGSRIVKEAISDHKGAKK